MAILYGSHGTFYEDTKYRNSSYEAFLQLEVMLTGNSIVKVQ